MKGRHLRVLTPELKVGIFALIAAAILLYITFSLGSLQFLKKKIVGPSVIVYFSSVAGLDPRSPVKVAGVDVGSVEQITLEDSKARVVIRLKKGIKLRKNAQASLRSAGILGEKFIELSGGTPEQPFLGDGDVLERTKEVADVDEVMGKMSAIATDVKAMTESFREVFGTEQGKVDLKKAVTNIGSFSENLSSLIEENQERLDNIIINIESLSMTLKEAFQGSDNRLKQTLRNMEKLTAELNRKLPKMIDELEKLTEGVDRIVEENRDSIMESVENLRQATRDLGPAIKSLAQVAQRIEEGKGTIGRLISQEEIYENVRSATEKLDSAVGSIKNITGRLEKGEGTIGKLLVDEKPYQDLRGSLSKVSSAISKASAFKLSAGFRGEHQVDEGEIKGYFTLKLQPRDDFFLLIEAVDDPRQRRFEEDALDEVAFSLQLGKKVGDAAFRIGLTENTFGLGADYGLMKNKLTFSLDAYDFSGRHFRDADDDPRLKFSSRFGLYRGFFATAGIDDILDDNFRTIFVGAGYSFGSAGF